MARPGPRPKPTGLKLLEGNPGKRRLNRKEPKPNVEAPRCPTWLDAEARAEWRRVVPRLLELRVIAQIDRACLATYCIAWSRLRRAEAELMRDGLTYTRDGMIKRHPAAGIAHEAAAELRAFAAEFGLTASSRTRVEAGRADEPEDMLTKFLRSKGGKVG